MTAITYQQQLRLAWGDSGVWEVTVTDADGLAVNITGCTMKFTGKLRASDADGAAVFAKTVGAGITLTDPTNGVASVTVAPGDTATLAPGREHLLVYDWKMSLAGQVTTVAYGNLLVWPAATRTAP